MVASITANYKMKTIVCLAMFMVSLSLVAQEGSPEGWDKIILEGKTAYMNINTGEISTVYPKGVTRKTRNTYAQEFLSGDFHVVKKGETLYRISKNSGVAIERLKRLNSLSSNLIKVGQKLRLN